MKLINNYKGKVRLERNKHVLEINVLKNNTQKPQSLDYISQTRSVCFGQTVWGTMFPQGVCQFAIDYTKYSYSLFPPHLPHLHVINCTEQTKRS